MRGYVGRWFWWLREVVCMEVVEMVCREVVEVVERVCREVVEVVERVCREVVEVVERREWGLCLKVNIGIR